MQQFFTVYINVGYDSMDVGDVLTDIYYLHKKCKGQVLPGVKIKVLSLEIKDMCILLSIKELHIRQEIM